jgi:hypothetical protein
MNMKESPLHPQSLVMETIWMSQWVWYFFFFWEFLPSLSVYLIWVWKWKIIATLSSLLTAHPTVHAFAVLFEALFLRFWSIMLKMVENFLNQ